MGIQISYSSLVRSCLIDCISGQPVREPVDYLQAWQETEPQAHAHKAAHLYKNFGLNIINILYISINTGSPVMRSQSMSFLPPCKYFWDEFTLL